MSGGSRDQVTRLLALAPYLQTRGEVPLKEVAADFDVTPAQMLKDLRVLYMCGLPGYGPGELIEINVEALEDDPDGLVRVDNADFLARPLRLGSNEASALIVALHALQDAGTPGSREVVERALAKLEEAAAAGSTPPLVDVHLPRQRPAVHDAGARLARAVDDDRQARLDYYVPTRDETTQRVVDPIAVLHSQGRTYLDAWCHLADDRRLFRIDRITALEILDTPRVAHDLEPRDLSEGLFAPGPDDLRARVLLSPEMRWFAEYYPVLTTDESADGGLEVTLAVSDERWLLRLALRFGPGLEVLEPVELRDRVVQLAAHAQRLHSLTA
ncbi:MAG TPA: WYL domain-containing protein [Marmoricola sp.]|nr:WYL domain-containing protein [Marmoricola sp.]